MVAPFAEHAKTVASRLFGSRPHCTEFVNADPDAVFEGLVRENKHYSFASSKTDSEPGVSELPTIANSVTLEVGPTVKVGRWASFERRSARSAVICQFEN
jgi:hypothetical protein